MFSVCPRRSLIVALLGAAKSASFAIPTILDAVDASSDAIGLREICLSYALLGPGKEKNSFYFSSLRSRSLFMNAGHAVCNAETARVASCCHSLFFSFQLP